MERAQYDIAQHCDGIGMYCNGWHGMVSVTRLDLLTFYCHDVEQYCDSGNTNGLQWKAMGICCL